MGAEDEEHTLGDLLAAKGLSTETQVIIRDCLDCLDDRQREVLWLYDLEGLTMEEISDVLVISVAWVHTLLYKSRRNMRDCLTAQPVFRRIEAQREKRRAPDTDAGKGGPK